MRDAVVLLSGGLDSATCLAIARNEGFASHTLSVRYGQRHSAEIERAAAISEILGAASHKEVSASLDAFGGSVLTGVGEVPKDRAIDLLAEIPDTYVPARNAVLLALALSYGEAIGAADLFIGVTAVDYSGYPDCRPEFIDAFERMANIGTKAGSTGSPFKVHAPLIHLSKAEIIRLGLELGVDYSLTHSCYDPTPLGLACGRCDACLIRKRAFAEIGINDPALAHLSHG